MYTKLLGQVSAQLPGEVSVVVILRGIHDEDVGGSICNMSLYANKDFLSP